MGIADLSLRTYPDAYVPALADPAQATPRGLNLSPPCTASAWIKEESLFPGKGEVVPILSPPARMG